MAELSTPVLAVFDKTTELLGEAGIQLALGHTLYIYIDYETEEVFVKDLDDNYMITEDYDDASLLAELLEAIYGDTSILRQDDDPESEGFYLTKEGDI